MAANGGVQGHWGLVLICDDGASLGRDGSGLADAPRIATPSSLLVLHGEPGSVISLVPLLLHSPHDTATPLETIEKKKNKHVLTTLIHLDLDSSCTILVGARNFGRWNRSLYKDNSLSVLPITLCCKGVIKNYN